MSQQQTQPEPLLAKKLLKVLKAIKVVKKSGYNSHHKYQYSTEADFIEAVRQLLLENGIIVLTSVEGVEKEGSITTVRTKHTFIDTDSGQSYTVSSFGQGYDSQDKGLYKAVTGSMKYFISKTFMIETQDDPENDGANPSYTKDSKSTTKTNKTSTTKSFTSKAKTSQPKAVSKPSFGKKVTASETVEPSF